MATEAFTGGLSVQHGDGASPEAFTNIEEVQSLSGLGKTNPLVDVTHHASTAREYIAGLPDGSELTIECNRIHAASSIQDAVIAEVDAKTNFNMVIALTNGTTVLTYSFVCTPVSWTVAPSYDDKTALTLVVKMHDITVA